MSMLELKQAFGLIAEYFNHEDTFFVGQRSNDLIASAEFSLTLTFPDTYRIFVCNYGAGNIFGQEFYGVTNDNFENSTAPNAIWLTLHERAKYDLPEYLILISLTGDGHYYALDYSQRYENGECPVVEWNPNISKAGDKLKVIAKNYGVFLLETIKSSVY